VPTLLSPGHTTCKADLPGIAAGEYRINFYTAESESKTINADRVKFGNAIAVENGTFVGTAGPNPNQRERGSPAEANGIAIHSGTNQSRTGSDNCITGQPGRYDQHGPDSSMQRLNNALNVSGFNGQTNGIVQVR
jgi:hypothetical protein